MANKTRPIAVIGAGSWGISLAVLLANNGNTVRLWGRSSTAMTNLSTTRRSHFFPKISIPDNIDCFHDLSICLKDVQDVLIATPSRAFHPILCRIKSHANTALRIAWGTKGIDPNTGKLLHQVALSEFPANTPLAVLSGPSFASEIMTGTPTAISLAGTDTDFIQDLIARFHSDKFRIYHNHDMVGVELCGVFKNILAIAIGIVDGLGLGRNAQAALITRGFAEMQRLCIAMQAQPSTLLSLAGLGDVVLTCTSNQSRNRRFGLLLGQGQSKEQALIEINQEVEGAHNVKLILNLASQHQLEMPIATVVNAIIQGQCTPQDALEQLMRRDPTEE